MSVQPTTKRKQARIPSKMNGDDLLQLKYMKNAEISPRVLSFNMASRVEMSRKINWGYKEQALNLEKVKKSQYLYYKQLKRLQQEKRTLQQQSYRYKQAEAKMDVEHEKRDRRIRKILDDYEEKSRAIIEDILKAANQKSLKKRTVEADLDASEEDGDGKKDDTAKEEEKRREAEERERQEEEDRQRKAEEEERADTLEEELSSGQDGSRGNVRLRQVWRPADAEKHSERRGSVYIEYIYVKPGARTMTIEVVEPPNSKTKRRKSRVSPHHFESDSDLDHSGKRRLSMRRRSSKTIEVNLKSPNEPKTVVRARSPELTKGSEEQTTALPPLKTVENRTKEPPPNSVLLDNYRENGVHDAISEVEDANSVDVMVDLRPTLSKMEMPQASPKARPSQQFKALPAISENQSLVNQEVAEEELAANFREVILRDSQVLIITPTLHEEDGASIPDSRSRSTRSSRSDSHNSQKRAKKPVNNIEYNKQKQREREEERQRILQLPYTAYTMDKEGKVVAMLGPPKPMDTKPPSNYQKYKRDKLLEKTREKQTTENETLQKFMGEVGDYVKAMPPPPHPNPDISIEEMAHMIEGETKKEEPRGSRTSLPGNLMIFLRNKYDELPEDMDPNSMEALARCKYLRDFDAEEAKEAKKAGRRKSSWQVNAQTASGSSPRT
ncbi:trichohyalin-like [Lineus longissimus]|uniref:trichohyalin-like n=1 Tax=Lineus longissimus TaxID=88925 RepID=UPI002B4F1A11